MIKAAKTSKAQSGPASVPSDEAARARGSLLGLAFGDALGAPVETWSAEQIARIFPDGYALPADYASSYLDVLGEGCMNHLRLLGLHTDDTQQAMALLAVATAPGGFSRRLWADWLLGAMRAQAWRGYGRNFAAAVKGLGRGGDAALATSGSQSAGNGAAMRTGPLGALLRRDPSSLARVTMEASLMTHADMRAALVAYAVAYTVAGLTKGGDSAAVAAALPAEVRRVRLEFLASKAAQDFGPVAKHKADQVEAVLGGVLKGLPPGTSIDPTRLRTDLLAAVAAVMGDELAGNDLHPNQGLALLSGLNGLLSGLLLGGEPLAILTDLVILGKDTDTAGAIAGTVLGARFGDAWIPMTRLFDLRRLDNYANFLGQYPGTQGGRAAPENLREFSGAESELTRREMSFRAEVRLRLGR